MHDLTSEFVGALARRSGWNPDYIGAEALHIVEQYGGAFYWGREAGEEWMHIHGLAGERHALIWTRAPLAVTTMAATPLRTFLREHQVIVIDADDWDSLIYTIDPEVVRAHGMPDFWHASPWAVPVTGFSILDLVWATE